MKVSAMMVDKALEAYSALRVAGLSHGESDRRNLKAAIKGAMEAATEGWEVSRVYYGTITTCPLCHSKAGLEHGKDGTPDRFVPILR